MSIRTDRLSISADDFAAERRAILDRADDRLEDHVRAALMRLGLNGWESRIVNAALDLFDETARAEIDAWGPVIDDMRDEFARELRTTLLMTKSGQNRQAQIETITRWVSTMTINAATEAATTADPDEGVGLEWVTMTDSKVRDSHEEMHGTAVPTGQPFEIEGVEFLYPGQPNGDPSLWINCRCVAAPTVLTEANSKTITAAGERDDDRSDLSVIVALPAEGDWTHDVSSEDDAHVTLLFLGDADGFDPAPIEAAIEQVAADTAGEVVEAISGYATLGDDEADVALLDAKALAGIRGAILGTEDVRAVHDGIEQYPTWIPHLTLGYPDNPRKSDDTQDTIKFDRLALWRGEEQKEFPMGKKETESSVTHAEDDEFTQEMADQFVASVDEDEEPPEITEDDAYLPVPWHGVLAPEGKPSGDKRMFAEGALRNRDLPLPLKYMKADADGHDGSVVVARIDRIFREDNLIKAEGVFGNSPDAYEAIRQLANGMLRGVSVDVDDAQAALSEDDDELAVFSSARISSATICAIPAFAEAYVALGPWEQSAEVSDVRQDEDDEYSDDGSALAKDLESRGAKIVSRETSLAVAVDQELLPSLDSSANVLGMADGFQMFRSDAGGDATEVVKVGFALGAVTSLIRQGSAEVFPNEAVGEYVATLPADSAVSVFGADVTKPDQAGAKFRAKLGNLTHSGAGSDGFTNVTASMAVGVGSGATLPLANLVVAAAESERRVVDLPFTGFDGADSTGKGAAFAFFEDGSGKRIAILPETTVMSLTESLGADGAVASIYGADGRTLLASATQWVSGDAPALVMSATPATVSGGLVAGINFADHVSSFAPVPRKTKDGPGWITDPKPTKRITDFWVDGPGAAKISWGAEGDFYRCEAQLAKYVQNPEWLAGLCANLHYRALRAWPGQASGKVEAMANKSNTPSVSLVASADQKKISADYFRNPEFADVSLIEVTEDGRVFGHLATWDVCHIGIGADCVNPPHSETDYGFFATGKVLTDAGPVAVGQISMGGGHAQDGIGIRAAAAHYDSTSAAVADVAVGEDEFGIWVSGKLRDDVDADDIHALRASGALSGDWREVIIGGESNMELVAALAVNVPGFPIPRPSLAASGGQVTSLVAASIPQGKVALSDEKIDERIDAAFARRERVQKAQAIRAEMRARRAQEAKAAMASEGR